MSEKIKLEDVCKRFSSFQFADGQIISTLLINGLVKVEFKDWKENVHHLVFGNVIAIESYNIEMEDLSHGIASPIDTLIESAKKNIDDDSEEFICFQFVSAWSENIYLKVVASDFLINSSINL